jgi:hypothetical protein
MKSIIRFGLSIVFLISTASLSFAKFTISPSVEVKEVYNDNIFLTDSDESDDFITTVIPRVILQYIPSKAVDLNLNYSLNFRFYNNHNELNDTSLKETQDIRFTGKVRPLNYFFIDIYDRYRRVPIDVRDSFALDNPFENMTDSNFFTISPYIEYPITPTLLSRVGYSYANRWYDVNEGNDSDTHSAFAKLTKKFPFRVSISLNYNFFSYDPEETAGYDGNQGSVEVVYEVGPNFKIWGAGGKIYIDFSDRDNTREDFWDAGAEYHLPVLGGTTLRVIYSKAVTEYETSIDQLSLLDVERFEELAIRDRDAVTTGVSERERIRGYVSMGEHFKVDIDPYYTVSKELETNREDKITGVSARVTMPLTTKLTASVHGVWENHEFLPENEDVDRYSIGGNVDYKLSRSITTSAGYRYNNRDTDSETADSTDYNNNIVWIQARVNF